eukprot:TRINITY_DN18684_c0_g1::TRINITY_DN18684_c0_g1_i1::g.20412::m.20412 TRINITY_DN18684_c0_g1::TRINITY_DN18684_c0_g1_i1::g.20412  ORF type:complete len:594 (+),score=177.31,sp/Q7XJS0/ASHR1_ARATH/25.99/7e-43,SET/PF00856.23/0.083,SET/PF00856.23/8.9e-09,TPR_12/PF13424.1/26,TPR_12/PF13424.1/0.00059,zf-MYND/PF01753.13/0.002,zf-MYND/PF01753.13/1.2e+04,TPR_10/PF13374.1/5.5e+03,TPR_10/PF13374.1/1.6e+02,TPR_10/PF13374.1/2 TRINITY_DN18684_c0_g1_i1:61-1842(+)
MAPKKSNQKAPAAASPAPASAPAAAPAAKAVEATPSPKVQERKALADYLTSKFGLELRYLNDKKGFGVFAGRDFKAGEEVLRTAPYAFQLFSAYGAERCHHCFQTAEEMKPLKRCTRCKSAYFHEACFKHAWKSYHKHECTAGGLPLPEAPQERESKDEAMLALRMFSKKQREELNPPKSGAAFEVRYQEIDWLQGRAGQLAERDAKRDDLNQKLAPVIVEAATKLPLEEKDGKKAPALNLTLPEVMDWLVRAQCNNFLIWDALIYPMGAGVYPIGSLLNHSCDPNCVLMYDSDNNNIKSPHEQVIRCVRDVSKGEELCHAYCDLAASTAERQRRLEEQYFFSCDCKRCVDPDHDIPAGFDVPRDKLLDGFAEDTPADEREKELAQADQAFERFSSYVNEHEMYYAKKALDRVLTMRLKHLHKFNLKVLATRCAIQRISLEMQDLESAYEQAREIRTVYEMLYPPMHPLLGIHYHTQAELAHAVGKLDEAVELLTDAKRILTITHGAKHAIVEGIDPLIEHMKQHADGGGCGDHGHGGHGHSHSHGGGHGHSHSHGGEACNHDHGAQESSHGHSHSHGGGHGHSHAHGAKCQH